MSRIRVRARVHHGSRSLDLTIPVIFIEEHDIQSGDLFSVEASCSDDGQVEIMYRRVKVLRDMSKQLVQTTQGSLQVR